LNPRRRISPDPVAAPPQVREEVQAENHSRDPAPARHAPRRPKL